MFEKNISRKTYNMIGMVFIFIGIAFMGLSVFMYLSPVESVNYNKIKEDAFAKCESAVRENAKLGIGIDKDLLKGQLIVHAKRLLDTSKQIYASSYIIEKCDGFVVRDYCIGAGCENTDISLSGGFYMSLDFKYQNKM
jgi:hypothetical protein